METNQVQNRYLDLAIDPCLLRVKWKRSRKLQAILSSNCENKRL